MNLQHNKKFIKRLREKYWLIKKSPRLIKLIAFLKNAAIISLFIFLVIFLGFGYYLYYYNGDLKDSNGDPINFNKLSEEKLPQSSYAYGKNNTVIGEYFYEKRDIVKYKEMPEIVKNAFLAAEDERFFDHEGFDMQAILRAWLANYLHKQIKQGASTITMQDTRFVYDKEIPEFHTRKKTYSRKLKEMRIALRLERRYTKEQLFEAYFNRIYFGHRCFGVKRASKFYFGKELTGLNVSQAALLVGIGKKASAFCPIHEPKNAKARRDAILKNMEDLHFITKKEYKKFLEENLGLNVQRQNPDFGYPVRFTKEWLLSEGYADEFITTHGGLKIYTSIDPEIQKIAQKELTAWLEYLNGFRPEDEKEKLEGAFVAINIKTGNIIAMVGGSNFDETPFNRALASLSPGSAFKPMVYAAAFEYGNKSFDDFICNCSIRMIDKISFHGKVLKWWTPKNFKEKNPVGFGRIPLPIGVIRSVNLATLNLGREIGMEAIIETSHDLGIWGIPGIIMDSDGKIIFKRPGLKEIQGGLDNRLPTVIGASDVNLVELVNAYATFARDGTYLAPSIINEVADHSGKIIFKEKEKNPKQVISKETADKITILLRAVTKIGTLKISMRNIEQQVAGKTGTPNGPTNFSVLSYTPEYVFGFRIGYDDHHVIKLPAYMKKVTGDSSMNISAGWALGPLGRKVTDETYKNKTKIEFSDNIEEGVYELLDRLEIQRYK